MDLSTITTPLVGAAERAIGGIVANEVSDLLGSGVVPQLAGEIVKDVLGSGGNLATLEASVLHTLEGRLGDFEAHTSARSLAQTTLKGLEAVQSPDGSGHRPNGLTAQQQGQMGVTLAQGIAVAYAAAGQAIIDLANAQAALELARGTAGEDAARKVREAAEEAYKQATVNIARAAAGQQLHVVQQVKVA